MATYSVFNEGAFTGQTLENQGDVTIFGNAFELTNESAGWVSKGARLYLDASLTGELELPFTLHLWLTANFSGTPAASGAGSISWGTWNEVLWATPVALPDVGDPFFITAKFNGSSENRLAYKASPGSAAIVSPDTPNLQMRSIADGRSYYRIGTGSTSVNGAGVLFSVDAVVSDGNPDKEPIPFTATRVSPSAVHIEWTDPGDAPLGVSVVRAPGAHSADGNGIDPGEPGYDPTTLAGATILDEGNTAESFDDSGLNGPTDYTYWLIRTGSGA